jgi:hypothetical protein
MQKKLILSMITVCLLSACSKEEQAPEATVFSATGDINAKLNEFRNQLGTLNTSPGFTSGRREINWEGVPDSLMGLRMPGDFFNPTGAGAPAARQRGLLYAGTENAVVSKTNFADINANAATAFTAFSGTKTFAVTNAAQWPVFFQVAGQPTAATVKGFGAVFSDVDKANTTFIEFYNNDKLLGRFYVAPQDNTSSFSFLGVYFPNDKITHIVAGHEGILADGQKDITQGGSKDLVILDDFIYSEPLPK